VGSSGLHQRRLWALMKQTYLKVVEACHYVCCGNGDAGNYHTAVTPPRQLSRAAKRFWKKCDLAPAEGAVIATCDGQVVGFFRYYTDWPGAKTLLAAGTWVDPEHRSRGLAKRMWKLAITNFRPKVINAVAVSEGGHSLVLAVKKLFPRIKIDLN